jgi:acetyltransferase-like isoleucine patch superfamily enzyme
MGFMIKRLLKLLFKKIYLIGKFEDEKENREEIERRKREVTEFKVAIDPTSNIGYGSFHNRFNDRSKITIGKGTQIRGELEVSRAEAKITIGDHSYVGPGTRISCTTRISIGDRVLISHNVNIYDNNSHPLNSKQRHEDFVFIFTNGYQDDVDLHSKQVIIEDDVWIGFSSTILKGVTIGKGAIIGAGTVISKDVPPYAVVVGNPARIVKYTD